MWNQFNFAREPCMQLHKQIQHTHQLPLKIIIGGAVCF